MNISVRRLGSGDEATLDTLAREDADFELAERGGPLEPLSAQEAREFLSDPAVLYWVAEKDGAIAGYLFCCLLKMRAGKPREVLLYEVGVRSRFRRMGVGRALHATLEEWMNNNGVPEVWVLADNSDAVEFYKTCGFAAENGMAVYMTRSLGR